MSEQRIELAEADRVKVFDLVEHLRREFNAFFDTAPTAYSNVDMIMAVHNFHKLVVQQLASESPYPRIILEIASTTFREAMEVEMDKVKL